MRPAAYAVLDQAALKHNLKRVRQCVPSARVMAVIKANGYGHGLVRVANALREADAFAVARVDEGIHLRDQGIEQRITVLEGFTCRDELEQHFKFDLEPVIHTPDQLQWLESGGNRGSLSVWLKLDTGMHRLGVDGADFPSIHQRLRRCRAIRQPVSLMTHLASADLLDNPTTERQIRRFGEWTVGCEGARSIANSAGILGWRRSHSDWVRPGIMLMGASPFADRDGSAHGLLPVMTLHSRLLAVKHLEPGDTVGYGGDWVCTRPTRLGVVAVGYGDGYPRSAKSGTPVLVNGRKVSLVGRVSMDMITVDLSDCPDARIDDPVVLWGKGLPVEDVARWASTIPYTLLCAITQRVRVFEEGQSGLQ